MLIIIISVNRMYRLPEGNIGRYIGGGSISVVCMRPRYAVSV